MTVDFSTEHGKRVRQLLDEESSIWLITVSPTGEPQPNPVWFVWEDDSFLIWIMPSSKRVENIKANPKVAIAFSGDAGLFEVTVFNGTAEFDDSIPPVLNHVGYVEKYKNLLEATGMTGEEANEAYTTRIRVRPSRLRGY